MPAIDVTELFTDPDFATTFDVIRKAESVGGNGVNAPAIQTITGIIGVVQPVSSLDLIRTEDGSRLMGAINVITKYGLKDGSGATDADIVVWQNTQYQVETTDDWTQWGAGFISALCKLKQFNPP
jgi:hypothetical protein